MLTIALLEERVDTEGVTEHHLNEVRKQCVFTTHTPVPAGHDQFDRGMVYRYAGDRIATLLEGAGAYTGDMLNMTHLALRLSHWANAVAMRHGQVSREMFPGHEIQAITNGVHSSTWVAEPMGELFDPLHAGVAPGAHLRSGTLSVYRPKRYCGRTTRRRHTCLRRLRDSRA